MDFIERFLGISPDGGSGALELGLVLLPILLVALLVVRRHFTGRSNGLLWQK
jgi:hypothetical protein